MPQTTTKKNKTTTTLVPRRTANPRRTTLAHLDGTDAMRLEAREHAVELPSVTANPRRTTLMTAPAASVPQD
ncbi:hypothetical protein CTZ27_17000 [Streptomyces griseocarneus]|nr:hypothetical protein CTZ27_17000 [Streptomyces griseocarneus]